MCMRVCVFILSERLSSTVIYRRKHILTLHVIPTLNVTLNLIVRQFGEYVRVNCGVLATSMKFSPMIEFDLVKQISYGAT